MTVKVLITRTVQDQNLLTLLGLLRQLRAVALNNPGYISGETLVSADQPGSCLVISNWISTTAWQAFENNRERKAILEEVGKLLLKPLETSVWIVEAAQGA